MGFGRRIAAAAMGAALLAGYATEAAAQPPYYAMPDDWRRQEEAPYGFSVELPVAPDREEDRSAPPSLNLTYRDRNGEIAILAVDLGAAISLGEAKENAMLNGMMEEFAAEQRARLVEARPVTLEHGRAVEATYRALSDDNIMMKARAILAGRYVYVISSTGFAGNMPLTYERVLASFRPVAPPPPAQGSR